MQRQAMNVHCSFRVGAGAGTCPCERFSSSWHTTMCCTCCALDTDVSLTLTHCDIMRLGRRARPFPRCLVRHVPRKSPTSPRRRNGHRDMPWIGNIYTGTTHRMLRGRCAATKIATASGSLQKGSRNNVGTVGHKLLGNKYEVTEFDGAKH
ncbi:hypothetical protein LZ31DRAFT_246484 [Colletotrichum somersetense]|nr:hypothetical protein LZ31DRAFT_246484 [Colletotrichum somersetense]